MSQADPGGTQGRLPLHFEHFALTSGTLRVEFSSWMKTPILRTLFQFLTPWCLVSFEMPFLASSYSSRKVKSSHKACVLLALCRHLRALHMVRMCGSPTGALSIVSGKLVNSISRAQRALRQLHPFGYHWYASCYGIVHLLHCG